MSDDKSTLSDVSFTNLYGVLSSMMYQYKFRIPPYYTLIVRCMSMLEGIALQSDPNFKVSSAPLQPALQHHRG
jgi:aarF domain-containing kinase